MESPATEMLTRRKKLTTATAQRRDAILQRVLLAVFITATLKSLQKLLPESFGQTWRRFCNSTQTKPLDSAVQFEPFSSRPAKELSQAHPNATSKLEHFMRRALGTLMPGLLAPLFSQTEIRVKTLSLHLADIKKTRKAR